MGMTISTLVYKLENEILFREGVNKNGERLFYMFGKAIRILNLPAASGMIRQITIDSESAFSKGLNLNGEGTQDDEEKLVALMKSAKLSMRLLNSRADFDDVNPDAEKIESAVPME